MVRVCHEQRTRMNPVLSVHPRCKKSNPSLPDSKACMFDHHATLLQCGLAHRLMEDCWAKVSVSWLLTLWSSLYQKGWPGYFRETEKSPVNHRNKALWENSSQGKAENASWRRMPQRGRREVYIVVNEASGSLICTGLFPRPCLTIREKSKYTEDMYSSLYKKIEMPWHLTVQIWKKLNRGFPTFYNSPKNVHYCKAETFSKQ